MSQSKLTEYERLTLEVLEAKVYQLEMQAISSRCTAAIRQRASLDQQCVLAAGHSGDHLHARSGHDRAAVHWSS